MAGGAGHISNILCVRLIHTEAAVLHREHRHAAVFNVLFIVLPQIEQILRRQRTELLQGLAAAAQHQLEAAVQDFGKADAAAKQEAAGQLLFAAVNAARLAGVDAEEALTFASKRFAQQCLEQEQRGTQVE